MARPTLSSAKVRTKNQHNLWVLRPLEPPNSRFDPQVSAHARGSPAARALLEVAAVGHAHTEAAEDAEVAAIAAV